MAKVTYLEFEKPVAQLEEKIQELRDMSSGSEGLDLTSDINGLEKKKAKLLKEIFNKLSPWEMSLLARHPNRPYTLDYINMIFTDFQELHGDRAFADDEAIVGGLARLADMNVVVIGNQKGRTLRERTRRNFGMARPEGYRKALRLMKLAEKFGLPVITFVDTPGAYPGIDAEERGQSEAIGHNIYAMSTLNDKKGLFAEGQDEELELDEEDIIGYVAKTVKKDKEVHFDEEDIRFLVLGELEYEDSLGVFGD